MDNTAYYQRNREIILNKPKHYYENDKKRLRQQARGKYRNLSEEDKIEKKRIWEKQIPWYAWWKELKIKRISKKKISRSKYVQT